VYVEPYQRRVEGRRADRSVVDSERVVLVHRPGHPPAYAFPAADVADGSGTPLPELDGYVTVPWGAADAWFEEGAEVFLHARNPYHRVDILPTQRHLRVEVLGAVVVDTRDTVVLYETSLDPKLYVERHHVSGADLVPSSTTTYCPYKGTATHWSARVGDEVAEDVAWSYEDPLPESTAIKGMISFYEGRVGLDHDVPPPAALG
jgi:uncharacterized protein (DUF427 family)